MASVTSEAELRRRERGTQRPRWWQAAALAVAFVSGIASAGIWAQIVPFDQSPSQALATPGEVITGVGETATMRLPDGTLIRLAPESRLEVPPSGRSREVRLEGRAFFTVARDPAIPFVVWTRSGKARVLGTRFDLEAERGQLRLLVVEGRVALEAGETQVDVGSGQMTELRKGERPSTTDVEDVWPHLSWLGRFLAFEATPLAKVRDELQRRFGVTLELDDPSLAEETVTVWFRNEPIESVIFVLCRLIEARCTTVDEAHVRMNRAPPTPG